MKKYLLGLAVLLMGTAMMTSCDSDNDNPGGTVQYYANGAYIVNAGNMSSKIDGSITFVDYTSNKATQNMFKSANNRALGGTVNDGIVYGNKVYIVSTDENTIEVVDKKTFRSIKQIKTTDLLGDADGVSPRHIIAGLGNVYVSTYGGYVAAIDTLTYSLQKKYEVGSYPEGMAGAGQYIAVANSDYGQGNGTISLINVATDQVQTAKVDGVVNPVKVFFSASGALYVLDSGSYDANWNQTGAGLKLVSNGTAINLVDCTMAALSGNGNMFYYINAPYTTPATPVTYGAFDLSSNSLVGWNPSEKPASPSEIAVDPIKGGVYILSYVLGDYGYADYSANGYVLEYNAATGEMMNKFDAGVGPTTMFFDAGYYITNN